MKLPGLIGIKLFLLKKALQRVVNKPAPSLIPRTSDEAKNVDCLSAEIRSLEGQYFDLQIDKITNEGFEGRLWDSKKGYDSEGIVLFEDISEIEFSATHFLEFHNFNYHSPLKLLIWEFLRIPNLIVLNDKFSQFWFNSKTPERTDRYDLLKSMVTMRLESDENPQTGAQSIAGKGSVEILANIHGERIISHPKYKSTKAKLELILESLVVSGDVESENSRFRAVGKALSTIAKIEQENRRHQEQMQHNAWIKRLTFALVFVGFLQAYINWSGN